jgi:hypothetical protein
VKEFCPHKAVIGSDTAYYQVKSPSKSSRSISLDCRCVSCAAKLSLANWIEAHGLLADGTLENTQCEYPTCFKPLWGKAKYCEEHLIIGVSRYNRPESHLDAATLRQALERTQWTYSQAMEEVMNRKANIADGGMPGAMMAYLDIEFPPASGKIFKVGLCKYHSGQGLVNARVQHDCSGFEPHKVSNSAKQNPFSKAFSTKSSISVYGRDRSKCTDLLDVHAMAAQFRKRGITPQSIFLTWHQIRGIWSCCEDSSKKPVTTTSCHPTQIAYQ